MKRLPVGAGALMLVAAMMVSAHAVEVRRGELIDSIQIEPAQPCRGQDVTVRVALLAAAADAKVSIAGEAGTASVLRFARKGRHRIAVIARDWHSAMQIERRIVRVQDCAAASAKLEVQRLDAGRVVLRAALPAGFGGVTAYRWQFGDGAIAETSEPFVMHDYSLRSQHRPTASWIAEVTMRSDAATVAGRAAVTIPNSLWVASRTGTKWLPIRAQPFAHSPTGPEASRMLALEIDDDDTGSTLERVELQGFACDDLDRRLPAQLPATTLSRTALEKQGWTSLELALPASLWDEPVCRAEIRIHARTAAGKPAVAMTGVELGLAASRRRVTDPELLERLRQARATLGRGQISEQDLRLLEATRSAPR